MAAKGNDIEGVLEVVEVGSDVDVVLNVLQKLGDQNAIDSFKKLLGGKMRQMKRLQSAPNCKMLPLCNLANARENQVQELKQKVTTLLKEKAGLAEEIGRAAGHAEQRYQIIKIKMATFFDYRTLKYIFECVYLIFNAVEYHTTT